MLVRELLQCAFELVPEWVVAKLPLGESAATLAHPKLEMSRLRVVAHACRATKLPTEHFPD